MTDEQIVTISIANDFSPYPAGRYMRDGDFNGTRFRKEQLVPGLRASKTLKVNFDDVAGFGSSFLEEAFGGLVRNEGMTKEFLDKHLQIETSEEELKDWVRLTHEYINDAQPVSA